MQYGTTYSVRPCMHPRNSSRILALAAVGSIQLLLGPASSCERVQMKVRCSTRATSLGSERARKQAGKLLLIELAQLAPRSELASQPPELDLRALAPVHPIRLREFLTCATQSATLLAISDRDARVWGAVAMTYP